MATKANDDCSRQNVAHPAPNVASSSFSISPRSESSRVVTLPGPTDTIIPLHMHFLFLCAGNGLEASFICKTGATLQLTGYSASNLSLIWCSNAFGFTLSLVRWGSYFNSLPSRSSTFLCRASVSFCENITNASLHVNPNAAPLIILFANIYDKSTTQCRPTQWSVVCLQCWNRDCYNAEYTTSTTSTSRSIGRSRVFWVRGRWNKTRLMNNKLKYLMLPWHFLLQVGIDYSTCIPSSWRSKTSLEFPSVVPWRRLSTKFFEHVASSNFSASWSQCLGTWYL